MGIPDRIILTLYTFLMAVVAVLVVLCSLGVIGQTAITAFFATIPGNWEYAVGGIIILLVSIRLLIAGIGATGMTSLTISSADSGKVSVGKSAIEDYVAEIAKEVYGVYGVKVEAKMGEEHISIRINASIEPGINIPETTDEIKYNVRDTIKKVLGMEIKDIDLIFKQIKALGSIFGLFIGVMFLILGFLQTIFLLICITAGFFLGNKLDKKEDLMEWLDRLLPPGYHK